MDLTEWDENGSPHNGNHQNGHSQHATRRSNGCSQDRYPEERRDLYQYRNGNVSREDLGDDMHDRRREGRRDNSVISNAVLNHLAGLHRRPVNRVRIIILCSSFQFKFHPIFAFLELQLIISNSMPRKRTRLRIT